MREVLVLCVATVWLPAMGCGGGGAGATTDPVPAGEFPDRFAAAWCGMLDRCCQASGGSATGTCQADAVARLTDIGTKAAADGATWKGDVAARCLDHLAGVDCASVDVVALRNLLDDCDDTWAGVVPPGGACQTYASCAELPVSGGATSGASCVNSSCVQVVRQPPGAACTGTTMTCDPLLATCVSGSCVALPGAGEACSGSCRPGLHCDAGMCAARLGLGQSCASDSACASGRCSGGRCASSYVADGEYCALP